MKKLLLIAFLLPSVSFGAAFDLFINQRNIANTATLSRTMPLPSLGVDSVLGVGQFDNLPVMWKLGQSMGVQNGELVCGPDWIQIGNKPMFATVATSGDYNDLANKPSIASQVNSDWSASSGVEQVLNKPTTLAGYGIVDAYPLSGNPSGFLTGVTSAQIGTALGFTPYSAGNPSAFTTQAGARSAVSLTTNGTAGAATYNSTTGVLNVPNYAPGAGTVTSITAGSGLIGGAITTSGTISMPSVGAPGSYSGVTTDAQGRVSAGTVRSQATATRSLNTVFQVSASRDALVQYSVQTTITASIAGGQDGDVFLDIASDSGFTTSAQSLDVAPCSQTYTLAIALQGVQKCAAQVRGYVPAGYYARIRTVNNTGTPSYLYRLGQEILQ